MVVKDKACKECGHLTKEDVCGNCNSRQFADKYKGTIVIFENDNSVVADKAKTTGNGKFAINY